MKQRVWEAENIQKA